MKIFHCPLLIALCLWTGAAIAQGSGIITLDNRAPLTNRDVIEMTRAKLSDAIISKAIQANRTEFDLSAPALIRLKNAGVSQAVIEAMLSVAAPRKKRIDPTPIVESATAPQPEAPPPVPVTPDADLPDDVGVYIKQHGKLLAIEPEIVNWKSGGVLKTLATAPLAPLGLEDKGHVNGLVPGSHSKVVVSWEHKADAPLEFYIRCQEGNSASEYQLLRLWDKGDRREFRAVTGGVIHRSGGAQWNAVQFKYEKIAPRIYKIPIPSIEPGEYGFLAPGAVTSANAASLGKIYSFRVPE